MGSLPEITIDKILWTHINTTKPLCTMSQFVIIYFNWIICSNASYKLCLHLKNIYAHILIPLT